MQRAISKKRKMQSVAIAGFAVLLSFSAMAQDKKVAVFDPAGSVENYLKEIVREEISSTLVNIGGYTVLERQMIDKVLEENKFQSGGLVDDSQVSEMGRRMGANLVFVTNITTMSSGNLYISCKMIDVQTARIDKQKTGQTIRGSNDLIAVIQKMLTDMFAETVPPKQKEEPKSVVKPTITEKPALLVLDGGKIFSNGEKLKKDEVRNIMTGTDALRIYNKGISRNKKGNTLITFGTLVIASGVIIKITDVACTDYYVYYDEKGNKQQQADHYAFGDYGNTIAWSIIGAGAAMLLPGITVKILGKYDIRKSVETYNNREKTTTAELKCNFTGNGVCVTLIF